MAIVGEGDYAFSGASTFKIRTKRCKYQYSLLQDDGSWSSTTTVRIKKLHGGVPGWPKLWVEWEKTMGDGGIVSSAVDGFPRRFSKVGVVKE